MDIKKPTESSEPGVVIWIDPGGASADDLVELYGALSELHRAYGGTGIVFRDDKTEVYSSARVPA